MAKVLIVDDSFITRRHVRELLAADGHEVEEASGGEEARQCLAQKKFDAMVLDLLMPGMTGQDLLKVLHEEGSSLPILVLTADIQRTTRQECLELGAAEVVNKPPDPDELRTKLAAVLGGGSR